MYVVMMNLEVEVLGSRVLCIEGLKRMVVCLGSGKEVPRRLGRLRGEGHALLHVRV